MNPIAPNNLIHLGAVGVGAWGAWNVSKGRTGILQYVALAAGAWGLYRFSQYGWMATPAAAALPAGATQPGLPAGTVAAPAQYNPWAALGSGLGQLAGGIYDLASGQQSGVGVAAAPTAAGSPTGYVIGSEYPGYSSLPYEAPPPGYQ